MNAVMNRWWSRLRGMDENQGPSELPVRVKGTEFTRTAAAPAHVKGIDQPLVWVVASLILWGLVMVYSASIALPDNPRMGSGYTPTYFLVRHAAALGVGFVAAVPSRGGIRARRFTPSRPIHRSQRSSPRTSGPSI